MTEIRNGMSAALLGAARWTKSSYSGAIGNCVELARLADGQVALRNSRDPNGPALIHAHTGIDALVATVKNG